ncbi:sialic acid-binding Ig-like lectin 11 [Scyliorhinus torazame]|uniref:sialic acid-binding Ig-like lectin 11 n=1 Tax=Scyliorhinus torazame TaxID=75743 RepID=UPI003B5C6FDA
MRYTTRETTFRNADGTFNTTSELIFTPTLQDHRTIFTCQVYHLTSKEQVIKRIILTVNYGPELVIHYRTSDSDVFLPLLKNFIYVEHQSFLELNCTADSNPASIVIWLKKFWARRGGIQLVAGVSSSILKKMNVDHSDSGDYICRAHNGYDSKESALTISLTSDFGSSFPVRSITMPIFVVSITLMLIWCCKRKGWCGPCNSGNSKQNEHRGRSGECSTAEDVDVQKKITTSEL